MADVRARQAPKVGEGDGLLLGYGQLPERRADSLTLEVVAGLHAGVILVKKRVDSVDRLIGVVVSPPDRGDGAIVNTRQQPGADRAAIRTVQV